MSGLCAICGAGRYCWLHDQPALDPTPRIPPSREVVHAEIEARVVPEVADFAKHVADRALGFVGLEAEEVHRDSDTQ